MVKCIKTCTAPSLRPRVGLAASPDTPTEPSNPLPLFPMSRQNTLDWGQNQCSVFRPHWVYFSSNASPSVDTQGFSVGIFCDVGITVQFMYSAIEIN
ncbi:hypothetical protein BJX64DRAFT_252323 [Aspergillus heterothallicus]